MKKVPIRLGPLALLLTVISICLTVLSVLSFVSARADLALAEKYAQTVKTRYELETEGQEYLRDAALSGSRAAEKVFEKDGSKLSIELRPSGNGFIISKWLHEKEWEPDESIGDLWNGL